MRGSRRSRSSPDGQGVTFVELFFDLVFVFAVTELTHLLRSDLSAAGAFEFVLAFWLVWWGWTQFTWALNAADTSDHGVQAATLVAVALAFGMAIGAGDAFEADRGLWFAAPYVAVRAVGLAIYLWVSLDHHLRRHAVVSFTTLSSLGLVTALVGGAQPTPVRQGLWALTIALDLVAATTAGRVGGWDIRIGHFAERHGLFVIIALGESLIAAGAPASGGDRSLRAVVTAVAAVAVICALWWLYFGRTNATVEEAVAVAADHHQSAMARDAYSLLHFPLLCGVVAVAAAIEEAVAHPDSPLPGGVVACLAGGLTLYLVISAVVHRRVGHGWRVGRILGAAVAATTLTLTRDRPPVVLLGLGTVVVIATIVAEDVRDRRRAAPGLSS